MTQPPTPGRPEVEVHQATALFFGSSSTAPLNLEIEIANPAKEPILVRRVRVQPGPGMVQFSIYPAERMVHETIPAGGTKVVQLTATAFTNMSRNDPTEPLGVRVTLDYESAGTRHQELYVLLNVRQ
jgi:hypothetical protein